MMRLTRTGIGLLTAQYRSVFKKCFLINTGLFLALAPSVAEASGLYTITLVTPAGISSIVSPGDSYNSRTFQVTVSADNETSAITQAKKIFSAAWRYDVNAQHYYNDYIIYGPNFISIGDDIVMEEKMFNEFNDYVINSENWATSSTVTDFSTFLTSTEAANTYQTKLNSSNKLNTSYINFSSSQKTALNSGITKDLVDQISANTSTIAAHTAVINALDNNYYRNIEVSRAEKLQKTSAVIVRSAKHDVTIFGRKSDKTALCAEILQSLRSFRMTESVANDNTVTTFDLVMEA